MIDVFRLLSRFVAQLDWLDMRDAQGVCICMDENKEWRLAGCRAAGAKNILKGF